MGLLKIGQEPKGYILPAAGIWNWACIASAVDSWGYSEAFIIRSTYKAPNPLALVRIGSPNIRSRFIYVVLILCRVSYSDVTS